MENTNVDEVSKGELMRLMNKLKKEIKETCIYISDEDRKVLNLIVKEDKTDEDWDELENSIKNHKRIMY